MSTSEEGPEIVAISHHAADDVQTLVAFKLHMGYVFGEHADGETTQSVPSGVMHLSLVNLPDVEDAEMPPTEYIVLLTPDMVLDLHNQFRAAALMVLHAGFDTKEEGDD